MLLIDRKSLCPVSQGKECITLEEAASIFLNHSAKIQETERCEVLTCSGRVLAEEVRAENDQPPFDRSPVDGYACRSLDIQGATAENPVILEVVEEIDAGNWPSYAIGPGQAARIMTGAPLPEGADCCVYQERTDYGEKTVAVYEGCQAYENYCFQGEDMKAGTVVLKQGARLTYVEAGILAGLGRTEVLVYRKARAAVLASGDELAEPGRALEPGKIYDNNLYFLSARLKELGVETTLCKRVADQEEEMAAALLEAVGQSDLVITTGGVSVGKKDMMHQALRSAGAQRLFWKILMKPGMPTIGSVLKGKPVVSLSGNPFGALADFELLCRPILAEMTEDDSFLPKPFIAELPQGFLKPSPSRRFLRGRFENGRVWIPEIKKHASGILSSMIGCNCLVDIAAGTKEIEAGGAVKGVLL